MKTNEFKLRIVNLINELIDLYFPKNKLTNIMMNSAAKFYIEQHTSDFDGILQAFCPANTDDIDVNGLLGHLEKDIFNNDTLKINIKEILPDNMKQLASMLPDKILLLSMDDIKKYMC